MSGKLARLLAHARAARRHFGKGIATQLLEAVDLRLCAPAKLGIDEYYTFGLADRRYDRQARREFGGWRMIRLIDDHRTVEAWCAFAVDKVAFDLYLKAMELPRADTIAVLTRTARPCGDARNLVAPEELRAFLADPAIYPVFVKPISSSYGKGTGMLQRLDADRELVLDGAGQARSLEEVVAWMLGLTAHRRFKGCLLQRVLRPHPDCARLAGERVSGLRVGTVHTPSGPQIYRAVFKVNRGDRITDNFEHGLSGNLLGDVDVETGALGTVIAGSGALAREVSEHPVTGAAFAGFRLPDWAEIRRVCIRIAQGLPGIPIVGIDVVPSDRGPVLLEVNAPGDFDLLQIAARRGVLADPYVRHVVETADWGGVPAPGAAAR